MSLQGKKLLFLSGSALTAYIVREAQDLGIYTLVTDWYNPDRSPAKLIADEYWKISTSDTELLTKRMRIRNVDGVITSFTDSYLPSLSALCEYAGLPCYSTSDAFQIAIRKNLFKEMSERYNIPIAKRYIVDINDVESLSSLPYPVVVKPSDNSGSRGFKVCNSPKEVISAYEYALTLSQTKVVLIEDYIPYNSVIIHYSMIDGKCYYCGMSDKYSCTFKDSGSSVMGLQIFPSKGEQLYLNTIDAKARRMFEENGFINGPIWVEAFYDGKDQFIFNEMGNRFGCSYTVLPVEYFYGFNQWHSLLKTSLGEPDDCRPIRKEGTKRYCILPIHIKPGHIAEIEGLNTILAWADINGCVPVHLEGETIENWGSALQVFCYLHVIFESIKGLEDSINKVMGTLRAYDDNGENLLYTLFDINTIATTIGESE